MRRRLNETGIGFAGIDGVWWRSAREPFVLPAALAGELAAIGVAVFTLLDVVADLYAHDGSVAGLLGHKVPAHLRPWVGNGRVDSLRPDFQLVVEPGGRYRLVATELEMCPSAHGFAHAMQVAYGLEPDLAHGFARYLDGRPLLFVGTQQWSEFLFEQLAFCRALADVGAVGRVLYDLPIAAIAMEVRQGRRWQPPLFGIRQKPADWNEDVIGRIQAHGLAPYCWPDDEQWPDEVGNAVVFRFGYVDCFAPERLARLARWQAQGATLLNPPTFFLDSKVVMATVGLPSVRAAVTAVSPTALLILDRCIPQTLLLTSETAEQLAGEKDDWVVKFAGFDGGNQAWGGRSLQIGATHSAASWRAVLAHCLALPWPVVAQRVTPSAVVEMPYLDGVGKVQWLRDGRTRLRTFFLRDDPAVTVCGAHLTVSGKTMQVSEATDAVQAPIVFN